MRLRELDHELTALLRCYPAFVTRRVEEVPVGDIPVFVFHTIVPAEFEAQLRYLADNGYRTLSLGEFLDTMAGRRRPGPREVLLTVDDARTSFWLYGYPLLRKHGLRATLFAITGWTPDRAAHPNLEDVWAGRATIADLGRIDPDDRAVSSWSELRSMHASGVVTVDSHSHLHRRVFATRELVGVIEPGADFSPSNAIHGPYLATADSPLQSTGADYVGLPLFPVRGFFEDGPLFYGVPGAFAEFARRARGILAAQGGRLPGRCLAELAESLPIEALRPVPEAGVRADLREDLARARETLRARLGDPTAGRTVCIPFTLGGKTVIDVAGGLGLEALFWGVSSERRTNRCGMDPAHLVRLKHDFIWRLPGHGRKTIAAIYASKVTRRLAGAHPY